MPVQLSCYSVCSSPSWPTSSTTGELMSFSSFWECHRCLIMYSKMYSLYKNHPTSLLLFVTAFLHEFIAASAWIEKRMTKITAWMKGWNSEFSFSRITAAHSHAFTIQSIYCFHLHKSCTLFFLFFKSFFWSVLNLELFLFWQEGGRCGRNVKHGSNGRCSSELSLE